MWINNPGTRASTQESTKKAPFVRLCVEICTLARLRVVRLIDYAIVNTYLHNES